MTLLGELLLNFLGRPYKYGAEWPLSDPEPEGPVDCSEFIEWGFWNAYRYRVPDGAHNQFMMSDPSPAPIGPDCLGFFMRKGVAYHVGLVLDDKNMIEARGDPFNAVILRPRAAWEAFPRFSGYRKIR